MDIQQELAGYYDISPDLAKSMRKTIRDAIIEREFCLLSTEFRNDLKVKMDVIDPPSFYAYLEGNKLDEE